MDAEGALGGGWWARGANLAAKAPHPPLSLAGEGKTSNFTVPLLLVSAALGKSLLLSASASPPLALLSPQGAREVGAPAAQRQVEARRQKTVGNEMI